MIGRRRGALTREKSPPHGPRPARRRAARSHRHHRAPSTPAPPPDGLAQLQGEASGCIVGGKNQFMRESRWERPADLGGRGTRRAPSSGPPGARGTEPGSGQGGDCDPHPAEADGGARPGVTTGRKLRPVLTRRELSAATVRASGTLPPAGDPTETNPLRWPRARAAGPPRAPEPRRAVRLSLKTPSVPTSPPSPEIIFSLR